MGRLTWTCAMTDAQLDEALMGELGPVLQRGFSRHRRGCARCHEVVAAAVSTVGALRALPLESPSPDFVARVVAARPLPEAAPQVSWLRAAQATVIWAVCLMVAVISISMAIWPGMMETPTESAVGVFGQVAHALRAVAAVGSATAAGVGAVVWAGAIAGFVAFYAAAFLGLRTFLLRRST